MEGLPEIPRHVVRSRPRRLRPAAVLPYAARPVASVAALEAEGTWLRVVDAGGGVARREAGSGGAPDAGRLSGEGGAPVGLPRRRQTRHRRAGRFVFPLDCS